MTTTPTTSITHTLLSGVLALLVVTPPLLAVAEIEVDGTADLPRFPSISPDARTVVFTWRGDLWSVPAAGGHATRLTSHPSNDLHSAWSPDGEQIAFTSDRTGTLNVYVMNADGSGIRQLTDVDRPCTLTGFGTDGDGAPMVMFHANLEADVYRDFRPYMVSPDGGDVQRVHDAFGSYPQVSADGARVMFARGAYYTSWSRRHYRGPEASDVWRYDRPTGTFTRLTTWDGNDGKARWIGDDTLLYLSDRNADSVNLHRMSATDGEATSTRVTTFEDDVRDFDVAADGRTAVLSAWDRLYTLDLANPNAQPVALGITASQDEKDGYELKTIDDQVTEAALSPDGQVVALVAYGEVYVRAVAEESPTRRVTRSPAREQHVAWSPDGLKLYFTSDRDGTESIYAAVVVRTRGELTEAFQETTGATLPPLEMPEEEQKGKPAGKKDDDGAQSADPTDGDDGNDEGEDEDGDDDEDAQEEDEDDEDDEPRPPALDPERWQDALTFAIEPVVQRDSNDRDPSPSPDGTSLAFRSTRGRVEILDLATGDVRTLLDGWDMWTTWAWSPDGRHIAYAQSDLDFNSDIFIVPADGSSPAVNVTRHPDNDESPSWSADGRILAFTSERVNEEYDVWLVFLDAALESLSDRDLEKYFETAAAAAKKRKPLEVEWPRKDDGEEDDEDGEDAEDASPVELTLDDAYRRVRCVTRLTGDESTALITPAGDRIVFTATGDAPGFYTVGWDGEEPAKLGEPAEIQGVSLTGDKVLFVRGGRAAAMPPEGGDVEKLDISDRIRIDLEAQSSQKFREAARGLGESFYSPTMNGTDWEDLSERYHELARRARTAEEFNDVANRFVGELNGSHLGIRASDPPPPNQEAYGRLGVDVRRVDGALEVTRIVPLSPADTEPWSLRVGDRIVAIELEPVVPNTTLMTALKGRVGKETVVTVEREDGDGERIALDLLMTPIDYRTDRELRYRAWRMENARRVAEWSDGRLGYIHIQSMGQAALDVFERDLFAAAEGRDGLIIDVRNNGGGWTTDRVLSSIMVQPHAYTIPRGADPTKTGHYPQDRLFIQRYALPMNLLCNEKSFSNAEIMSHAFKTLERGTLVGQQTYGGVISTGGWSLIDGTSVRMPFRGWFLNDGTDMELNGAEPHIVVEQTPQAETRGDDEQLRAAVDDLMKRLPQ